MPEKKAKLYKAIDKFMRKKMLAQNAAYTAISDYNDSEINYAECQSIVFNAFQEITGVILAEFKPNKLF